MLSTHENEDQKSTRKKIEGIFSFVSGLTGIMSFLLDYPELAFGLVVLFGIGVYMYFGDEIKKMTNQSRVSSTPKISFWVKEVFKNRLLGFTAVLSLVLIGLMLHFLFKETYYFLRQGWVEKIGYSYQNGMSPIYLKSLSQPSKVLDVVKIINPVIYHNDRYDGTDDEISFESYNKSPSDWNDGSFDIYISGYDPDNSILEPSGDSVSSLSGNEDFAKFPLGNKYTYFVFFYNPQSYRSEYVRLHFVENENPVLDGFSKMHMTVFVSHLKYGESRFNRLVSP